MYLLKWFMLNFNQTVSERDCLLFCVFYFLSMRVCFSHDYAEITFWEQPTKENLFIFEIMYALFLFWVYNQSMVLFGLLWKISIPVVDLYHCD